MGHTVAIDHKLSSTIDMHGCLSKGGRVTRLTDAKPKKYARVTHPQRDTF